MIYTLTFAPSLDYYLDADIPIAGDVMRADSARFELGGKGLNVSTVLKTLEVDSKAIIFTGGFVGDEILRRAAALGLDVINIKTESNSRINVKLPYSEINAPAPALNETDIKKLSAVLDGIDEKDTLVISGKVPDNINIQKMFGNRKFELVCDVSGQALKEFMKLRPVIIKPNVYEICEYFDVPNRGDFGELAAMAREMAFYDNNKNGADFVLLTMGKSGMILVFDGEFYGIHMHMGEAVNTVGAGDSALAGFMAGLVKFGNQFDALRLANAAGSAAAFSEGLPSFMEIEKLYNVDYTARIINI
jgi:1-phosphofructokinase